MTDKEMPRWQQFEEYLLYFETTGRVDFSVRDYAHWKGCNIQQGTSDIWTYRRKVRDCAGRRSGTSVFPQFQIDKVPGTKGTGTRWQFVNDRSVLQQNLHGDIVTRVKNAYIPDMRAYAVNHPGALETIDKMSQGFIMMMEAFTQVTEEDTRRMALQHKRSVALHGLEES